MNPLVITSQKLKRRKHKHTENHHTTRGRTKRRTEKNYKNNQKTSSEMAISTYISIITLTVNELNVPVKRHRMTDWIKK